MSSTKENPSGYFVVEPSYVDKRWCIEMRGREMLVPTWLMPFVVLWAFFRARRERNAV